MAAAAWHCRWLGLAFLFCATPVLADQLDTSNTAARVPARQVLIDQNHLRVEEVLSDATLPWRDGTRTANPGITRATLWTWFVVTPADAARVLTIDNPLLDTATVYVADGTHIISRTRFGTAQPFAMRIFRSDPDFTVEVPPADRPLTVLIEARAIGSLRAVPELRTRDAYRAHLTATALIRGVYYGTLVVMVLYNIGLAISLKDRAYSFYVGYSASILLLLVTLDGTGYQYLWPQSPTWQTNSIVFAIGTCMGFLQLFARDFLRVPVPGRMSTTMTILATLCFAHALAPLFSMSALNHLASIVLGSVTSVVLLIAGVRSWRSGFVPARLYCLAHLFLLTGAGIFVLREFSSITDNFLTIHGLQLGTTADVVLLSLALGIRIKTERSERERARAEADALSVRLEEMQREQALATKEHTLQESLQRARQLQVLGQMAGGFGHEFNNILTSMVGFAELALERARDSRDDTIRRFLTEIQSGGRRAAELVDQLLTYSGGNRRDTSEVTLSTLTERALAILRPTLSTQHRLDWTAPTDAATAHVDPDRLQQAIINLCLNARDAMPERGVISVRVTRETFAGTACSSCLAEMHDTWHVIQVADTGAAIQGDIASIFMPFHSTRPGDGGGLGLAVVHGVAHEYGGHLLVRSNPGGGNQINLCLPT